MRIALAQINPTVGDLAFNSRKAIEFIARAKIEGAALVVFPELSVTGYPPRDLLLKPQFIEDTLRAVEQIASHVSGIEAVVGYAERNQSLVGRPLHNSVALLREGKIVSRHFKTLLPTYDVFDESRYFEPGPAHQRNNTVVIGDVFAGLSICEDLWNDEKMVARRLYHQNPIADLSLAGAQVMINTSASPFVVGKHDFRLELFASQVRQFGKPLVYVNQVGGNDELVFDGNSVVFDAMGNVIAQAKDFEEELLVVDVPLGEKVGGNAGGPIRMPSRGIESIYKALVLGLRDYVAKCGFTSCVLGLSGGIDSALTAALAAAALGKDKVVGVAMPSRFSSEHSISDARLLAENLGIEFHVLPITEVHEAYERTLAPAFAGRASDVTEENLQARVRGGLLMAFSNKFNHLLLTTGNKSELAVGYCTLYGDMCGGLAVISDVPKTTIWEMSRWINEQAGREVIPRSSIEKVPSAELRPNQTDQDSLPPYDVLDGILFRYVEEEKSVAEIISEGFDGATVLRVVKLIDRSEYKRRQAAPGIKVTSRAFGLGRRMPIAQNYQQSIPR
ncbi:MAG: NAD+ synthase [Planctomycetota bacterium]|nr:NAD+ synthase [Planctomycetota bacterium]